MKTASYPKLLCAQNVCLNFGPFTERWFKGDLPVAGKTCLFHPLNTDFEGWSLLCVFITVRTHEIKGRFKLKRSYSILAFEAGRALMA